MGLIYPLAVWVAITFALFFFRIRALFVVAWFALTLLLIGDVVMAIVTWSPATVVFVDIIAITLIVLWFFTPLLRARAAESFPGLVRPLPPPRSEPDRSTNRQDLVERAVGQGPPAEAKAQSPTGAPRKVRTRPPLTILATGREPKPVLVSLLCGWSTLWVCIWLCGFGVTAGLVAGAALGFFALPLILVPVGAAAGGLAFFLFALVYFVASLVASLLCMGIGYLIALLITRLMISTESWRMNISGYRRLSDREAALVMPIIAEIADALDCEAIPTFLIHDIPTPGAWTYPRHIVLSKRSLNLERSQLAGMIAHEFHHYLAGDSVYSTFLWACALPLALIWQLSTWCKRISLFLGLIVSIFTWPASVMTRFLIVPVVGASNRRREYAADATATEIGFGPALMQFFEATQVFEQGRNGWDAVMASTHPPMELRIEAVERRLNATADELLPIDTSSTTASS